MIHKTYWHVLKGCGKSQISVSQFVIITGPNGAGKGTLLNALLADKPLGAKRLRTAMNRPYRSEEERKERVRLRTRHFTRESRVEPKCRKFMELEQVRPDAWYGTRGCDMAEVMGNAPFVITDIDLQGTRKWLEGKGINTDSFVRAAQKRGRSSTWIDRALEAIKKPKVLLVTAKIETLLDRMVERAVTLGQNFIAREQIERTRKAKEDIALIPALQELASRQMVVIDNTHMRPYAVVEAAKHFIQRANG